MDRQEAREWNFREGGMGSVQEPGRTPARRQDHGVFGSKFTGARVGKRVAYPQIGVRAPSCGWTYRGVFSQAYSNG